MPLRQLVRYFVVLTLFAAACSVSTESEEPAAAGEGDAAGTPAATSDANAAAAGGEAVGTLNVLVGHWTVGSDDSPFEAAKEELEAAHDGLTVTFDVQQGGGNVKSKLLSSMAAGEAPDVAMVDSLAIGEMVEAGVIQDLSGYVESWEGWEDILPTFKDAASWDGKPYGVFMNTDLRLLVWNKKLFEEAGLDPEAPPESWDDLIEKAKAVNNPPAVYGFVVPGGSSEHLPMRWYMFLRGAGGQILDDNGCAAFNSEAGVRAAEFYQRLVEENLMPADVLSASADDNDKALAAGKYAMGVVGSWFFNFTAEAGIDTPEAFNETFGAGAVPTPDGSASPPSAGGWTVAIPADAPNPDLAWEFITTAMNEENQREWAISRGYVPVRESLSEDEEFGEVIPFFDVIKEQVEQAKTRPPIPEYGELSAELQSALQGVMLGEVEAQEALDAAAEAINGQIDGCAA